MEVTIELFIARKKVRWWPQLKTVKQEESVARSRFADCPVCKNHTLKLKRTVQVGRCKSCNETYKVIVVYVKTGRKPKASGLTDETRPGAQQQSKAESSSDTSLPAWQLPSDSSLFGSTTEPYSGLSEALFGKDSSDQSKESGSSNSQ